MPQLASLAPASSVRRSFSLPSCLAHSGLFSFFNSHGFSFSISLFPTHKTTFIRFALDPTAVLTASQWCLTGQLLPYRKQSWPSHSLLYSQQVSASVLLQVSASIYMHVKSGDVHYFLVIIFCFVVLVCSHVGGHLVLEELLLPPGL